MRNASSCPTLAKFFVPRVRAKEPRPKTGASVGVELRAQPSKLHSARALRKVNVAQATGRPGALLPSPVSPPTHPREGLSGVDVDPAPGSQGLSQPPPSRRALSASRCSAGCRRRAEPARRAVLGWKMRCARGPPPRRARRFSTADSGQPRAPAASPGGPRPTRAPGPLPPGSGHPAGQRRALEEGPARAAKAQLSLLKRTGVVGNRTRHPGRYLGPIKVGGGWPLV